MTDKIKIIRELPKLHDKGEDNTAGSYAELVENVKRREAHNMDEAERALRAAGRNNEAEIFDARIARTEPRIQTFVRLVRSANRVGKMLHGLGVISENPFRECTLVRWKRNG